MARLKLIVLATGGTIAGTGGGGATAAGYKAGQLGVDALLAQARELELDASLDVELTGAQVAGVGSQDIGWKEWRALYTRVEQARRDASIAGVVITHGTDTAEETAFLLDSTVPPGKPVVLVGAMRPADAVGADGLRNFANAARVAADPNARHRGVLIVMGDTVLAAVDARKISTSTADAFAGYPRGPLARVTPASLDWFGPADREGREARFAWPSALPPVLILYAHADMDPEFVVASLAGGARGLVLAGLGNGNAPREVLKALAEAAKAGVPVVRASRVDFGSVDRNVEVNDDARGFIAARTLNPQKARLLLQLALASDIAEAGQLQRLFDEL